MKVVLAKTTRECELACYERSIPPKSIDVRLVPTDSPGAPAKVRGLSCFRADVISVGAHGRYHDEVMRTLEPAFLD